MILTGLKRSLWSALTQNLKLTRKLVRVYESTREFNNHTSLCLPPAVLPPISHIQKHMDLEKYASKYSYVSTEELKKIRDTWFGDMNESVFETNIKYLHTERANIKKNGTQSIRTCPLVQMLSVSVQPKTDKQLAIYGRIHAEICDSGAMIVHELYNRDKNAAEILVGTSNITLGGPDFSTWPLHECTPSSMFRVMLFDGDDDNVYAKEYFYLDDTETEDDYEHVNVKCKVIRCNQGSLTFRYIVIPFGMSCRMQVFFFNRRAYQEHDFVNVNGKVSVRYGNCAGEECVVFEKQGNDFERVEIHHRKSLQLSRCWVALPAYSSMVVDVDLSEFETGRKIANETLKVLPLSGSGNGGKFVQDDIVTTVRVSWFPSDFFGRSCSSSNRTEISTEKMGKDGNPTEEAEEMDTDGGDESSDDESDDSSSSNLKLPWDVGPHEGGLWPDPAVEIFSVFIGREKPKEMKIYGSIEVQVDDLHLCYIFKREEKDALVLTEHMKVLPILDGSRLFEHCAASLGMKFDIKDVNSRLGIKGYVEWDAEELDTEIWHERQMCSLIQGQTGFAAVHYSIFSYAVGARLKIYCQLKAGCMDDEYPKIYGSLVTQYSRYDYSTRYNKDLYRIVLLKRTRDDSVEPTIDWTIPLSRSMVVVPSYSTLIFNVDLSVEVSGKVLTCARAAEIQISESNKMIETPDFSLRVEIDWCIIK